jgi:hypothetical protein
MSLKGNPIRAQEDLPPWFDLNHYREVRNMDAAGWAFELGWRSLVLREAPYRWSQDLIVVTSMLKNPIKTPGHQETQRKYQLVDSVASLTVWEVLRIARDVASQDRVFERYLSAPYGNRSEYKNEDIDKLRNPVDSVTRLLIGLHDERPYYLCRVEINMMASNEQIEADFGRWLRQSRDNLGDIEVPEKEFTEQDFKKWANLRILPYLDLTIWSRAIGRRITNAAMGDKLLGHEDVDRAEKIRKTIKPKAERLISPSALNVLRAQVRQSE